jgi:hypothetical protein
MCCDAVSAPLAWSTAPESPSRSYRIPSCRVAAGRGSVDSAIQLCRDICYNLRQVWGSCDPVTLDMTYHHVWCPGALDDSGGPELRENGF